MDLYTEKLNNLTELSLIFLIKSGGMGCEELRIFVAENGLFKVKCGLVFILLVKPSHFSQMWTCSCDPQSSVVPEFFMLLLSLRR